MSYMWNLSADCVTCCFSYNVLCISSMCLCVGVGVKFEFVVVVWWLVMLRLSIISRWYVF